jgi:5-methylcytosine-specific restriction endonuclease McrA
MRTIADALSGPDLLARLHVLAGNEREAAAELVAHLAALDNQPTLYAAQGYASLFVYCTQALGLSEDVACNRIDVARTCRRFPVILERLASGLITFSAVRLLRKHLTDGNCHEVLAKASRRSLREIEARVAELAPQPDVPTSVRKLPTFTAPAPGSCSSPAPLTSDVLSEPAAVVAVSVIGPAQKPRPVIRASAPERYRVQFTIGQATHEKLRRLQALLRREIPDGDPAAIFDQALDLLLQKVERAKVAATMKPPRRAIRRATDRKVQKGAAPSRHIPSEVKRAVWQRDGGQCAFVSPTGRRCTERSFLEFHHAQPYARQGPATIANVALRCRCHNQYEADLIFGSHGTSIMTEQKGVPALPHNNLTATPHMGRTSNDQRCRSWASTEYLGGAQCRVRPVPPALTRGPNDLPGTGFPAR